MKFLLLFLLALSHTLNAEHLTPTQICKDWKNETTPFIAQLKTSFSYIKLLSQVSFKKSAFIKPRTILPIKSNGGKLNIRFFSTSASDSFLSKQNEDIEQIQNEINVIQNNLKQYKKELLEILSKVETEDECISTLEDNESILDQYNLEITSAHYYRELHKQLQDLEIFKLAQETSKMRFVKSVEAAQIGKMTDSLNKQKEAAVMLMLHSDVNGILYDKNGDRIPKTFFEIENPNLSTILLYTCNIKAVTARYKLKELALRRNIQIVFPELTERGVQVLGEVSPANFVSYFIKSSRKYIKAPSRSSIDLKSCVIVLEEGFIKTGEVFVKINGLHIGSFTSDKNNFIFPCKKLGSNASTATVRFSAYRKSHSINVKAVPRVQLRINRMEFEGRNNFHDGKYSGTIFHVKL